MSNTPAPPNPPDLLQATPVGSQACESHDSGDELQALDRLGDVAALADLDSDGLLAVSQAWAEHQPGLLAGCSLEKVEAVLPGLRAAAQRALSLPQRRLSGPLGASARWSIEIAPLGGMRILVRLLDHREQGLALQRQLDDREQLIFSSRVLAVGEMATTLAHELNQPIGTAANLLRGLRARAVRQPLSASWGEDELQTLQRALDQLMFASRVVTRMREVTSAQRPRHAWVDFAALVRSSAALLDWDFHRSGARVELDLPIDGARLRGDAVMLQQLIVNLVRNALDALRADPGDDPYVRLAVRAEAEKLILEVHDSGGGIAPDMATRLFTPFATNKSKGMGIGLAICRSITELHQGRLSASPRPRRGSVFRLELPLAAVAPTEPTSVASRAVAVAAAS